MEDTRVLTYVFAQLEGGGGATERGVIASYTLNDGLLGHSVILFTTIPL